MLIITIYYVDLLWTAPEHINLAKLEREGMSQKGDVYSFAIIVQEISTRTGPFNECGLEPRGKLRARFWRAEVPAKIQRNSISTDFPDVTHFRTPLLQQNLERGKYVQVRVRPNR